MPKMYLVTVRWIKTTISEANIASIERQLGSQGEWLRFSAFSWLYWTNSPADQISLAVRTVLHADDSVMVIRVVPSEFAGWAPEWVWKWLQDKARSS